MHLCGNFTHAWQHPFQFMLWTDLYFLYSLFSCHFWFLVLESSFVFLAWTLSWMVYCEPFGNIEEVTVCFTILVNLLPIWFCGDSVWSLISSMTCKLVSLVVCWKQWPFQVLISPTKNTRDFEVVAYLVNKPSMMLIAITLLRHDILEPTTWWISS